jgi:hypothetical protein
MDGSSLLRIMAGCNNLPHLCVFFFAACDDRDMYSHGCIQRKIVSGESTTDRLFIIPPKSFRNERIRTVLGFWVEFLLGQVKLCQECLPMAKAQASFCFSPH